MTDSDLIAAYLAKNAPVTVPEGVRTTTPREMHAAVRGDAIAAQRQRAEESYARPVGDRMVTDHAGREFWHNAEGEWL